MSWIDDLLHRRERRTERRRERSDRQRAERREARLAAVDAEPQSASYRLHRYVDAEGSFDYDAYRAEQIAGNKEKIQQSWVREEDIDFLAGHVRRLVAEPRFGICHGTRRGLEQQWLAERLGCDVIGTEISDNASEYPRTIEWDFHETKPEWLGAADFIYSNAFDHSYDPEKALNAWMSCLRVGGVCFLEHSNRMEPESVTALDPFGARLTLMPWLILGWGEGRYAVREVLESTDRDGLAMHHLAVQRFL